ncbi:hypothetical protein BGX30_005258, partial [Mortierella sp. GBA39]
SAKKNDRLEKQRRYSNISTLGKRATSTRPSLDLETAQTSTVASAAFSSSATSTTKLVAPQGFTTPHKAFSLCSSLQHAVEHSSVVDGSRYSIGSSNVHWRIANPTLTANILS